MIVSDLEIASHLRALQACYITGQSGRGGAAETGGAEEAEEAEEALEAEEAALLHK